MSNEHTNDIIKKIEESWLGFGSIGKPTTWFNDKTKLNANNLNAVSDSIIDLQTVVSANENTLRKAVTTLAENQDQIISTIEDGLRSTREISNKVISIEQALRTAENIIDDNKIAIDVLSNTVVPELRSDILSLENRILALESMIAAGTQDPDEASLDENTKYYIKYEE